MAEVENNPFSAIVVGIPLVDEEYVTVQGKSVEDVWAVILNVGALDGVELRQKFVIFSLGPELFDPRAKQSLGHFEVVRGEGEVSHVQERMCTVRSLNVKVEPRALSALAAFSKSAGDTSDWMRLPKPFGLITVGDFARRI